MAGDDKKITQLDELFEAANDDVFAIVDDDEGNISIKTKKITKGNVLSKPGPVGDLISDTGKFTSLEILAGSTISEFSSDGTLAGDSDSAVPTEKAVKTYVDAQIATTDEHNELLGLQGGDSTSLEYFHLIESDYNNIVGDSFVKRDGTTPLTADWDAGNFEITTQDLSVDATANINVLKIGNGPATLTESAGILNIDTHLDVSGHQAIGNNAVIDFGFAPATQTVINASENFGSEVTGGGYGFSLSINTIASDAAAESYGAFFQVIETGGNLHYGIYGVNSLASVATNSNVTEVLGVKGSGAVTGDNSTIGKIIGGDFSIGSGFGMVGATLTIAAAGRFQLLPYGSGEVNIIDGYGVLVEAPSFIPTGTINNLYGLYIKDQSAAGFDIDYNLYSSGVSSKNKFEGDLTVDGTAIINVLKIDSDLSLSTGTTINEFSSDGTLTDNSDLAVPTEQAVKTYVDGLIGAETFSGVETLISGDNTSVITFSTPQVDSNYAVTSQIVNEVDSNPSLYVSIIIEKTALGFTILFSGIIDSINYEFDWIVSRNDLASSSSKSSSSSSSSSLSSSSSSSRSSSSLSSSSSKSSSSSSSSSSSRSSSSSSSSSKSSSSSSSSSSSRSSSSSSSSSS